MIQGNSCCSHLSLKNHSLSFIPFLILHSPELLVADVVSDDVPVALLLVRLVPHHVQLGRGQCTDPDVFRSSFRPFSVCYELQRDKTLRPAALHCQRHRHPRNSSLYSKTLLVDNKVSMEDDFWISSLEAEFLINIRRETPTVWKRQSLIWNNAVAANPGLNSILSCCSLMNCHSLHENPLHKLSCSSLINIH